MHLYRYEIKIAVAVCKEHWGKCLASCLQNERGSADSISQSTRLMLPFSMHSSHNAKMREVTTFAAQ